MKKIFLIPTIIGAIITSAAFASYISLNTSLSAKVQGDKLAVELLRETGYYIGIASASIVNLLNPELIIIFGGLSGAGEFLFAPIRDEIKKRAFPTPAARVKVVPAILGNTAGAIGAAGIALAEVHPE